MKTRIEVNFRSGAGSTKICKSFRGVQQLHSIGRHLPVREHVDGKVVELFNIDEMIQILLDVPVCADRDIYLHLTKSEAMIFMISSSHDNNVDVLTLRDRIIEDLELTADEIANHTTSLKKGLVAA